MFHPKICGSAVALIVLLLQSTVQATPVLGTELAPLNNHQTRNEKIDSVFVLCLQEKYPRYPNEMVMDHMDIVRCGDVAEVVHKWHSALAARDIDIQRVPEDAEHKRLGLSTHPHVQIEKRTQMMFTSCMKGKYPMYPNEDSIQYEDIEHCRDAMQNQHQSRGITDIVGPIIDIFGKSASLKTACTESTIPKNFQKAADFRASARRICDGMIDRLITNGTAIITETLSNGFTKQAAEIYNQKKLIIKIILSLSPQARAIMNGLVKAREAYDIVCTSAVSLYGTMGQGCTGELSFLGGETTGVREGFLDILIKGGNGTESGIMRVDYYQPGETV